jgi:hypothetical protein
MNPLLAQAVEPHRPCRCVPGRPKTVNGFDFIGHGRLLSSAAHTRRAYKPIDPAECDLIEGGSGCPCYCDGDLWLLRLDAGGKVLWEKTYFKMSTDGSTPKAIAALADGTFVLSGVASEPPYDSLMLRFDGNGNLIAEERGVHISAIGALPGGGVALAGWKKPGALSISALPPALKAVSGRN